MSEETIEQIKARLKREDEEKERAFQRRLKEIDAEQAEWRKERERAEAEEERKREAERRREQAERQRAEEARHKDDARDQWMAAGGTAEAFEKAWPGLWEEILKRHTLETEEQARLEYQRYMARSF
jgi:dTMP kinase